MFVLKYNCGGRDLVRSIVLICVVWAALCPFCCQALGQAAPAGQATPAKAAPKWREDPVAAAQRANYRPVKKGILRGGALTQAQQETMDAYYNTYAFARWTLVANRAELAKWRKDLRGDFDTAFFPASKAAHTRLNQLALAFMSRVAKPAANGPDYHPAVRVNAMLAIGELNLQPATMTVRVTKPLPGALVVLKQTVEDPNQLDAVKVAAMIGIIRHARFGGIAAPPQPANVVTGITNLLVSMAAAPPAARPATVGTQWMRAQAAEALGAMKVAASEPVTTPLTAMVGDSKLRDRARFTAARVLGQLDYTSAAGLDASNLAALLGNLVIDVCAEEYQAAKTGTAISRRRLKACMKDVLDGLTGIGEAARAAGSPHEANVTAVKTPVAAMLGLPELDGKSTATDQQLQSKLTPEIRKLQAALKAIANP